MWMKRPEKGFFPPLASLITSAGRLLVAIESGAGQ
jgi:hypothetical protein